ncbi:MAG: hypothetical protein GX458_05460 [Phyllobacteriaceae bacterium]|nr:hypothetical protein [Phyllobacteriaceae bacterium]
MRDPSSGSSNVRLSRRGFLAASVLWASSPGAAWAEAPTPLTFDGLYSEFGVRGLVFSALVKASAGRRVAIVGYMAPPLKAEAAFFVLTREPLAICPFCQSDADWPSDIVVVRLAEASPIVSAGTRVTVTGRLEVGPAVDPDTGFVSQLRIVDAAYVRGP